LNPSKTGCQFCVKLDGQTQTRTLFLTKRQLLIKYLFEESFFVEEAKFILKINKLRDFS